MVQDGDIQKLRQRTPLAGLAWGRNHVATPGKNGSSYAPVDRLEERELALFQPDANHIPLEHQIFHFVHLAGHGHEVIERCI